MLTITTCHRFIETRCQKRVLVDGKQFLKRDEILGSFSTKFRTQASWGAKDIGSETEGGGVSNAITDILKKWDLDNPKFHLILKNKLRQSKKSYNSKR